MFNNWFTFTSRQFVRRALRLLTLTLFLSSNSFASASPDLDFDIPLLDGRTINPTQFKGEKPVYLKFWATWCKPCIKEMPHLQHIQDEYGDDIAVVAVNIGINESDQAIQRVIENYDLDMPVALDDQGNLAKSLHFVGTPFHVLINQSGQIVHQGHEADEKLDRRIALLSSGTLPSLEEAIYTGSEEQFPLRKLTNDNEDQVVYFTATWCDWYLQDTRPAMSEACASGQNEFNLLAEKFTNIQFKAVVSHLWTEKAQVEKYAAKYKVKHPILLDDNGDIFFSLGIRNFPTFVVLRNNKETFRTNELEALNRFVKNNFQ